jgi:hypothetical protein
MSKFRIELNEKKYTVILDDKDGSVEVLRYGEPWPAYQDSGGLNNLEHELACRVVELLQPLQLIAQGWEVIESDGSTMTIQAPTDWDEDGEKEMIVNV